MAKFCSECGQPVNGEAKFCGNCGAKIMQSAPQKPAPETAVQHPAAASAIAAFANPLKNALAA